MAEFYTFIERFKNFDPDYIRLIKELEVQFYCKLIFEKF